MVAPVAAGESQLGPAIAFDGTNYFVVWEEGPASGAGDWQIFGTRVSQDGTVIDVPPVQIAGLAGGATVAFNGTDFVVVWVDSRAGGANYQLYAARVTPEGVVLDPSGVLVDAMYSDTTPSVACGASGCLLTWNDFLVGGLAARLDSSLAVLDEPAIAFGKLEVSARPVATNAGYLVAWNDGGSLSFRGTTVSAGGSANTDSPLQFAPNGYGIPPAVASDGVTSLVVWTASDTVSYTGVYGARVTGGALQDPAGIWIAPASGIQPYPAATYDGRQFVAVWEDVGHVVSGARVSVGGAVVDNPGFSIPQSDHSLLPAIGSGGDGRALVVYSRCAVPDADTFGACEIQANILTTRAPR